MGGVTIIKYSTEDLVDHSETLQHSNDRSAAHGCLFRDLLTIVFG